MCVDFFVILLRFTVPRPPRRKSPYGQHDIVLAWMVKQFDNFLSRFWDNFGTGREKICRPKGLSVQNLRDKFDYLLDNFSQLGLFCLALGTKMGQKRAFRPHIPAVDEQQQGLIIWQSGTNANR